MAEFHDYKLTVPQLQDGCRLDQFFAGQLALSKRAIRRAIDNGGVYVNGKRCRKAGQLLHGSEVLRLVILANESLIPFSPAQLLWQDACFYLLHKKSGQYAQEALHRSKGTLPDELARHLQLSPGLARQLRPVHRLDRDTSGLILFCSDPKRLQHLQQHWHSHVQKSYLAVVLPAPEWEKQRITLPIGKRRDQYGRYHVDKHGRACDTEAEVLQRHKDMALMRLIPHSGRTHQLRIHLSYLGCPILGDRRYGGKKHSRLMLHAHTLCIQTPAMDKNHAFTADPEEDWQWQ